MISFKTPIIEQQFKTTVNPDLRLVAVEFGQWSADNKLPTPVITDLGRSRAQNVKVYVDYWLDLQRKGSFVERTPAEQQQAARKKFLTPKEWLQYERVLKGRTLEQLTRLAEARSTWHWWHSAIDWRTRHYAPDTDHLARVSHWFHKRLGAQGWELKEDRHGSGPHIHTGRVDPDWKKFFEKNHH